MQFALIPIIFLASLGAANLDDDWIFWKNPALYRCERFHAERISDCVQQMSPPFMACKDADYNCLCARSHFLHMCYATCDTHPSRVTAGNMRHKYCKANATYGDLTNTLYAIPKHGNDLPQWISPEVPSWEAIKKEDQEEYLAEEAERKKTNERKKTASALKKTGNYIAESHG